MTKVFHSSLVTNKNIDTTQLKSCHSESQKNSDINSEIAGQNTLYRHIRVLVVTSCTGEKFFKSANQLTIEDFKNPQKLEERKRSLSELQCPACDMYTGLQHVRVMEAIQILRNIFSEAAVGLKIVSAGYGLLSENDVIVPYSVTFNSMKSNDVIAWGSQLGIHKALEDAIVGYDLIFVLLGDKYLRALNLPVKTNSTQTIIFFGANKSLNYIHSGDAKTFTLTLSNQDASRFGCALVGLKGQVLKLVANEIKKDINLLHTLYKNPEQLEQFLIKNQPSQLEIPLGITFEKKLQKKQSAKNATKRTLEDLNCFLELPPSCNQDLPMQYFIPEWEDKVDAGYDFLDDKFSPKRNAYTDDIYAHEIYQKPNYHGVLVSKVVIDKRPSKKNDIEKVGGIHNFIKFPGEIMGDCGAFGYIKEEEPPYTTVEILDYYEKLQFNYGVSIDHLIVGQFAEPGVREKRYDLTLRNAEEFISKHSSLGYSFKPIGVAQGWNPEKYAEAVKKLIEMGYDYIALGGLARAKTKEILEVLQGLYGHLTPKTKLHLFGVGRIDAIPYFRHLGVTSFDSASPLRKAWFDAKENYHTVSGTTYAAVRIPFVDKHSPRIKYLLENSYTHESLKQLEQNALNAIREYDRGNLSIDDALKALLEFDELLELPRDGKVCSVATARRLKQHTRMYRELLENKPWKECECVICQQVGVESVIFRGNDRNRRRGFHNTYVFFKRFEEFLESEKNKNCDNFHD